MQKDRIEKLVLIQKAIAEVSTLRRYLGTIKMKYESILDVDALSNLSSSIVEDLIIPLEEQSDMLQELCGLELD